MTAFLDWSPNHPHESLPRALQLLHQGELVGFPSESAYTLAASALQPAAVERLAQLPFGPLMLALSDPLELADWSPWVSPIATRLARQGWPGPLALQVPAAYGQLPRLPEAVQARVGSDGTVTLRTPGHASLLLAASQTPLVIVEVPGAYTGPQLLPAVPQPIPLILQDGPTHYSGVSTVVRVVGRGWSIQREGLLSRALVEDLARCLVLFVCTGNTCRSPMAMALCRVLLAGALKCSVGELPQRGFQVASAGMSAYPGLEASPEAVDVVAQVQGDLAGHRSQPISADLLARADHLFSMTRSLLLTLLCLGVPIGARPRLLSPEGVDVADPIGSPPEVYQACAEQMTVYLRERLPEILESY